MENPLSYRTAPAGNAFMLAAFAALVPVNVYIGIRYKTPLQAALVVAALLFEIVGHVAQLLLGRSASRAYSAIYMIGTNWGATLLGSAVFLVLPHAMVIYGQQFQLVPNSFHVNLVFLVLDICTLVLLSVGIGLASNARTASEVGHGMNVLLAGLAFQAASLVTFLGTYRYFRYKLSHRLYILDSRFSEIFLSRKFKVFMMDVQVAASLLLVRAAIRIAAFANGTTGPLATSQVVSFLLDHSLVLLAALAISVLPAGRAFGPAWRATSPPISSNGVNHPLSLRLRRYHGRKRSDAAARRVVSQPCPSFPFSAFSRSAPGAVAGSGVPGVPGGLPAHPAAYRVPPGPLPLMSPKNNPVYQRAPYASSPTQAVPFMAPEDSPDFSSTSPGWPTSPVEQGRRHRPWGRSSPGVNEMVRGDAIWD